MAKGIVYVMTTAVTGLIKIGETGTANYRERMRNLENNGYANINNINKFFAIEVEDYQEKENLLKEVFKKQQVGTSELFALDKDLVKQLLLAFDGRVVFPENEEREQAFDIITQRREGTVLSKFMKFYKYAELKGKNESTIKAYIYALNSILSDEDMYNKDRVVALRSQYMSGGILEQDNKDRHMVYTSSLRLYEDFLSSQTN